MSVAYPAATGTDPVAWTSQQGSVTGQTPLPVENRLEGTLSNVVSVGVDGTIAGVLLPEPSRAVGLAASVGLLAVLARRRRGRVARAR